MDDTTSFNKDDERKKSSTPSSQQPAADGGGDQRQLLKFNTVVTQIYHNLFDGMLCRQFVNMKNGFTALTFAIYTIGIFSVVLMAILILGSDTNVNYTNTILIVLTVVFSVTIVVLIMQITAQVYKIHKYEQNYVVHSHKQQMKSYSWLHSAVISPISNIHSYSNGFLKESIFSIISSLIDFGIVLAMLIYTLEDLNGIFLSREQVDKVYLVLTIILICLTAVSYGLTDVTDRFLTRTKDSPFTTIIKRLLSHIGIKKKIKTDLTVDIKKEDLEIQDGVKDIFSKSTNDFINTSQVDELLRAMHTTVNKSVQAMLQRPFGSSDITIGTDIDDINKYAANYVYERDVLVPYHNQLSHYLNYIYNLTKLFIVYVAAQHWTGWGGYNSTMVLFYVLFGYITLIGFITLILAIQVGSLKRSLPELQESAKQFTQNIVVKTIANYFSSLHKRSAQGLDIITSKNVMKYHRRELGFRLPRDMSLYLRYVLSITIFVVLVIGVFSAICLGHDGRDKLNQCIIENIYAIMSLLFVSHMSYVFLYFYCVYILETFNSFELLNMEYIVENAKYYGINGNARKALITRYISGGKDMKMTDTMKHLERPLANSDPSVRLVLGSRARVGSEVKGAMISSPKNLVNRVGRATERAIKDNNLAIQHIETSAAVQSLSETTELQTELQSNKDHDD